MLEESVPRLVVIDGAKNHPSTPANLLLPLQVNGSTSGVGA